MSSISEILSTYGVDEHEDGTVVVFTKQFEAPAGRVYTYCAVRGNGTWHCTNAESYKWTKLIDFINEDNVGDRSIYTLSEVTPIWEDPDIEYIDE